MPEFLTVFSLIGVVLILSALASGIVVRAPISFPMIFFGLGFLLGDRVLGVLSIGPHDRVLEAIATVSLAFVLFLDAVRLRLDELTRDWLVPVLVLGPGTLLNIALISIAAWLVVGASPMQALLLGAILSSTDPVVLQDVIHDRRIPRSIRHTLRIEAGTNDLVVLPVLLVLIAVARGTLGGAWDWSIFLLRLIVLGPLVGFIIGAVGAWLLGKADALLGVSRAYPRESRRLFSTTVCATVFSNMGRLRPRWRCFRPLSFSAHYFPASSRPCPFGHPLSWRHWCLAWGAPWL
jgi:sodium/hydrogen antiporter